jgi:hypothetical protein
MRGEFIGVWSETWTDIWEELANHEAAPDDMFCELYRELTSYLKAQLSVEELADIIDNPIQSIEAFKNIKADELISERALVDFFEKAYDVLDEFGKDDLNNEYFNLLLAFINKFSLRYDLRHPCFICPTLPGLFSSLIRDITTITNRDPHLNSLMKDFEDAVRDLRMGCSDNRIRTCIQKQVNLIEAMGMQCPGVTHNTLGAICNQVGTWPHDKIKEAMQNLYKFTCDYPGIRHGGTPANALRSIEMRDMVAISILLVGFAPYLTDRLDADVIYRGEL